MNIFINEISGKENVHCKNLKHGSIEKGYPQSMRRNLS